MAPTPESFLKAERDIKWLCDCMREKYERLRDVLEDEDSMTLSTIETIRTPARQAHLLKIGASWTTKSRHLANKKGRSEAIDICPVELLTTKGWTPSSPMWKRIGEVAAFVGLRWGGLWKQRDLCHLELPHGCECD